MPKPRMRMLSAMIAAKRETAWHETIDGSKVRAGRGGRGKADDDAHVVMQRKVQVKAAKVDVDRRTRGLSVKKPTRGSRLRTPSRRKAGE